MQRKKPFEITSSIPALEPLIDPKKVVRVKRNNYREIRSQLRFVEYELFMKEWDRLRELVQHLMDREAQYVDRSAKNRSFWILEHPKPKTEVRRLRAKVKNLEKEFQKYQKKVAIPFP